MTLPPSPSPSPVLYELSDKKEGDSRMKGGKKSAKATDLPKKIPCQFCTKSSTNLQKFVSKYYELNGFFLKNGGKFGHNADFPRLSLPLADKKLQVEKVGKKGGGVECRRSGASLNPLMSNCPLFYGSGLASGEWEKEGPFYFSGGDFSQRYSTALVQEENPFQDVSAMPPAVPI